MSLIKTNDFPRLGFDESLKRFQDWDLWLTMSGEGKYGLYINRVLFTAYYNENGISCRKDNIKETLEIVKDKHNPNKKNKENKQKLSENSFRSSVVPSSLLSKEYSKGKVTATKENMVDIVIIRFNLLDVEEKCIEYVKKFTTFPYKLTIIDNYRKKESLSKVWNDAVKNSTCKYVCLLNSDAFVTEGWLEEMMGGFVDDSVAGVGPSGDRVGGEQGNLGTPQLAKQNIEKYQEVDLLSGFCILLRADLNIDFPLEVPFYGGEHAWIVKAKRLGYKFIWSKGSFVYHLGEASGKKEGNISKLRAEGQKQYVTWLASVTPVLFTTFNRLDYTKKSLRKLAESTTGKIFIFDNASIDGTAEWLASKGTAILKEKRKEFEITFNANNVGVAGAMNFFLGKTPNEEFIAKVDNDTIVPRDWLIKLLHPATYRLVDVIQAKHKFMNSKYSTFDSWMQNLKRDPKVHTLFYSNYVGGSGVIIKRNKIENKIPENIGVLRGWTTLQKNNPNIKKAFCTDVEVELLDMLDNNKVNISKYPEYYSFTGRVLTQKNTGFNSIATLESIKKRLGKRFAYSRFGDGEIMLMEGIYKGKQTTQWDCPGVKEELKECFLINDKDFLMGNSAYMPVEEKAQEGLFLPPKHLQSLIDVTNKYYTNKAFYTPIALHYLYVFEREIFDSFLEQLKGYKVCFVGGEHLRDIPLPIKTFIPVPTEQAYNTIDTWYDSVVQAAKEHDIMFLAIAMTSNIVQKRLWDAGIQIGTIDLGSVANAMVHYKKSTHSWIKKLGLNK